jgi:hypothetical protein
MLNKTALCLILAALSTAATLIGAQSRATALPQWRTFRPAVTTEADFLRLFGEPENVVMRFIGLGEFQRWRTSAGPRVYDFEYLSPTKDNLIFDGPFGGAGKVVVRFSGDRKLWQVDWVYYSAFRQNYRTGEKPSRITVEQMEAAIGKPPLIKKSSAAIGPFAGIYRFRVEDVTLDVEYHNEVSDVTVHLSKDGFFVLD